MNKLTTKKALKYIECKAKPRVALFKSNTSFFYVTLNSTFDLILSIFSLVNINVWE